MAKRSPLYKLAKDLAEGDHTQVRSRVNSGKTILVTVLAAVPSVQVLRRNVILVTFRTAEGRELHRTYYEGTTVPLLPEEA